MYFYLGSLTLLGYFFDDATLTPNEFASELTVDQQPDSDFLVILLQVLMVVSTSLQ